MKNGSKRTPYEAHRHFGLSLEMDVEWLKLNKNKVAPQNNVATKSSFNKP